MKFFDMFQYAFMNKAFLMGALIALCCSCLGLFLILRKYSMIGDGLGHVSFASVAVALRVGASDLIISIPMVTIASFLICLLYTSRCVEETGPMESATLTSVPFAASFASLTPLETTSCTV